MQITHSMCVRVKSVLSSSLYVDDLILGGDCGEEVEHLISLLKKKFDMKDSSEMKYFLGIEVITTRDGIWFLQWQYALNMLSKYGMDSYKPISIPLD